VVVDGGADWSAASPATLEFEEALAQRGYLPGAKYLRGAGTLVLEAVDQLTVVERSL
jgi:hypothetical protein